jgi:hypothetical protein
MLFRCVGEIKIVLKLIIKVLFNEKFDDNSLINLFY